MEQSEKHIQMTTAPVGRLIGKLAVPTVITMLITSIYNMADTFFVGQINDGTPENTAAVNASAAVGVAFAFMAIIQACGFLFGQGSGNYISRMLGQQRREDAARMASVGFYSALTVGVVIAVLGLCFLDPLCYLLGATRDMLPETRKYLGIILLGTPYMTAALTLNNQLRFQGSAFNSMIGIGAGGLLNIVLDPLFIFGLDMGVSGAALATVISQAVSFCLLLFGTTRRDNLRVSLRLFRPSWAHYVEMFRGGFPSLCRQMLGSVALIAMNFMAGVMAGGMDKEAVISGMSVAGRITNFAFAAILGFGQGFQPVCGFNYGAGLYHRVKEAFWFCVRLGTVLLVVASVFGFIFAPQLVDLFHDNRQVLSVAATALRLQCVSFPLTAWFALSTMLLQTIGRVKPASFLSAARQGLFFVPFVLTIPWLIRWLLPSMDPILGVQMAQPLADIATSLVAIPFCVRVLRHHLVENPGKEL